MGNIILNKNQSITTEGHGIEYILETVENLGALSSCILGVHLTRSLSGDYVKQSREIEYPFAKADRFWDRFRIALDHVSKIDQHEAFEDPKIVELFDLIQPEYLVFEFTYKNMIEWQKKIHRQLEGVEPDLRG